MNKGKVRRSVLSLALIAVVVIGATWAYLTTITNEEINAFSFLGDEGIDAELEEPNWDENEAKDLVPGSEVEKDPLIYNTGVVDEYVGLKMTFRTTDAIDDSKKVTLTDAQMALLLDLIVISNGTTGSQTVGFSSEWDLADSSETNKPVQTWVYIGPNTASYKYLVKGTFDNGKLFSEGSYTYDDLDSKTTMATVPLFDLITFKTTITDAQYAWLNGDADYVYDDSTTVPRLKNGFEIFLEGAGVQASVFDGTTPTGQDAIVDAIYTLLN